MNISRNQLRYGLAFLLAATAAVRAGAAPNKIWAWGSDHYGETDVPPGLTNVVAIAAGINHSMALNGDGTVVVWGDNTYGETNVPPGLSNVVSIAAGGAHCLALKSTGTVVAWGWNRDGQTNVPSVITNVPGHFGQRLTNVIAIAGCQTSSLALTSDGILVGWGDNTQGQLSIPSGLSNVAAIAGGGTFMALKSNGTVTVWGYPAIVPPGLSNVVAIADGESEFLALLKDGSVVMWDQSGAVTAGPTNVSAIAGDYANSVFLLRDGTVVVWGDDANGITNVPVGLTNVTAIAGACSMHVLALAPDQTLTAAPPETLTGALRTQGSTNSVLTALVWPNSLPTEAWFEWGTTTNYGNLTPTISVGSASNSVPVSATIAGLIPLTTYDYRIVASNSMGYSYGDNASFTTLPISNYVNGISVTNSAIRLWSTAIATNAAQPSVWATTNLANWTRLGSAVQTTPGVFEFFDQGATNSQRKFYRLSWP